MEGEIVESPRKKLKTDQAAEDASIASVIAEQNAKEQNAKKDDQASKEVEVGITEFVSAGNEGFAGILKKRYTDFLVNEILPSGQVLHLRSTVSPQTQEPKSEKPAEPAPEPVQAEEPKPEETADAKEVKGFKVSDEDNALLESFFGAENAQKIIDLHERVSASTNRPSELGKINAGAVTDRDLRTKIHQAIRRIFNSQLESSTDGEGNMTISAAPNRGKPGARGGRGDSRPQHPRGTNWDELGGPYLHFTIYKENKDTMEVLSFIARQLKMNAKSFQFAGTKDRRGVTAQRACALRLHAERLARLNGSLRNAALGDFEYCKHGLDLGDLNGNEFVVTLRECDIPGVDVSDRENVLSKAKDLVGTSLRNLHERGYFNYYGLQRFGTFSTRTDMVGVKMLRGDFRGACEAILHFSPHVLAAAKEGETSTAMISADDKFRAESIDLYQQGKVSEALDKLPRKFSAETSIIRHLGRAKSDYLGALQSIPRNLRLMYVHAYQSRVWNFAVGERWRLYGDKIVEGDLVLIHEHRDKEADVTTDQIELDADGEVIIKPTGQDASSTRDDIFTRARALSATEAASGKYKIFDIVLPLPGFDILYPANAMTDFYKTFMGAEENGALDPFDMRRKWKDISLSGSYRKVLSRMGGDYSFDVKLYAADDEQFVRTDLENLKGGQREDVSGQGDKVAVILKFQLGSSQYATMALRELMKGKVKAYTPDFGGR